MICFPLLVTRLSVQDSATAGVPLLAWVTQGSGTDGALLAPVRFMVSRVARTRRSAPRSWSAA
jgi:hypothetical protein